jgi:Flp pilus assembly protein TadG
MRVGRLSLARIRRDEQGAVLMIVALSLLVLLGMLVLTVDLGRSVAIKRQMVNGTDAAALAAAQQCALGKGSSSAASSASAVLAENRAGATVTTFTAPQCDNPVDGQPKFVVVESSTPVDYYFAPIFGFDEGVVAARAVAQWGAVGETNPVPITVDNEQLLNCGIVQNAPPPDELDCDLTYPKDALQEPRWGVLDLSQWGDADAAPCSVDANTLKEIIESGGWPGGPLPEDNYDCLDNGLEFSVWDSMEGRILTFPVIDINLSTGTVKPNKPPLGGQDCTGAEIESLRVDGYDCQIDTAYVIGFISLLVNSVVNNGSTVEVDTTYLGPTTGNGVPCPPDRDCTDFGLSAVRLVE